MMREHPKPWLKTISGHVLSGLGGALGLEAGVVVGGVLRVHCVGRGM